MFNIWYNTSIILTTVIYNFEFSDDAKSCKEEITKNVLAYILLLSLLKWSRAITIYFDDIFRDIDELVN